MISFNFSIHEHIQYTVYIFFAFIDTNHRTSFLCSSGAAGKIGEIFYDNDSELLLTVHSDQKLIDPDKVMSPENGGQLGGLSIGTGMSIT